jgi:3-hydroxyisobutyrate dehydrogenase
MVAGPQDFKDVVVGPQGILSGASRPRLIVDSTTVSPSAGEEVRAAAAEHGVDLLAAPVSGNPKVVKAGHLTICVSGPAGAWEEARPYLELLAKGVTYVGEGEKARLVKVCHNLMLGVVSQCMAEITVLAEKGGVSRADFLAFLNDSVMGSMFTRYKTPAFVNLDFTPTFTPALLLKDFHLGFEAAREMGVPMPVAATTQEIVQGMVGQGYTDVDFAALLEMEAKAAGYDVEPENVTVSDGLGGPVAPAAASATRS